jgi:hypothetical protein
MQLKALTPYMVLHGEVLRMKVGIITVSHTRLAQASAPIAGPYGARTFPVGETGTYA